MVAYQFVGLAPAPYRVVIVDPDKGDLAGLIPTQAYTGRGETQAAVTITDASVQGVDFSTLSSVKSGRVYSTRPGHVELVHPEPGCSHRRQLDRSVPVPGAVLRR